MTQKVTLSPAAPVRGVGSPGASGGARPAGAGGRGLRGRAAWRDGHRPKTVAVIITLPPPGLGERGHYDPGKNPPARGIFNAKCRAVAEVLELLLGYAPCPQVLHRTVQAVVPAPGVSPLVDKNAHRDARAQPFVQMDDEPGRSPGTEAVEVRPHAAGAHDHREGGRSVEPQALDRRGEEPVARPRQERLPRAARRGARWREISSSGRHRRMAAAYCSARRRVRS